MSENTSAVITPQPDAIEATVTEDVVEVEDVLVEEVSIDGMCGVY